ncbi:hypothetical protein BU16DRAFT_540752 [Lophium mytilinum]|uniref:Uncharacterized protein n=1 Tax=Lophium mytilinum TaxID=390894 RepID=A0A6A6QTM8_9PEZI|nr:hypothetical protein BU16DRAFT_540752 [Lophium mytilinum]
MPAPFTAQTANCNPVLHAFNGPQPPPSALSSTTGGRSCFKISAGLDDAATCIRAGCVSPAAVAPRAPDLAAAASTPPAIARRRPSAACLGSARGPLSPDSFTALQPAFVAASRGAAGRRFTMHAMKLQKCAMYAPEPHAGGAGPSSARHHSINNLSNRANSTPARAMGDNKNKESAGKWANGAKPMSNSGQPCPSASCRQSVASSRMTRMHSLPSWPHLTVVGQGTPACQHQHVAGLFPALFGADRPQRLPRLGAGSAERVRR